jgi:hypothetical protein
MIIPIKTYSMASLSAKTLRDVLKSRGHSSYLIKVEGSSYVPRRGHTVVCWGSSGNNLGGVAKVLNRHCGITSDKHATFLQLQQDGVPVPDFTTSLSTARGWFVDGLSGEARERRAFALDHLYNFKRYGDSLANLNSTLDPQNFIDAGYVDGLMDSIYASIREEIDRVFPEDAPQDGLIYCRTLTRASCGRGIVVAENRDDVVPAGLYTKGIKCKREYRIHMFDGEVIDLVAKCKRHEDEESNPYIRNHNHGWIFARDAVRIPDSITEKLHDIGKKTMQSLSMDFGAIDVVRDTEDNVFVLEVNSAPGMEGTTIERYVNAIERGN